MAVDTKRGAQAHKLDCQCKFCQRRRAKAAGVIAKIETPIETFPPDTPILEVPIEIQKDKVKQLPKAKMPLSKRSLAFIGGGLGIFVIGLGFGVAWYVLYRDNIWGVLPALLFILGGLWLAFYHATTTLQRNDVIIIDGKPSEKPKAQVNSLSLYHDRLLFEDVPNPEGQPWRWRQDGRSYFVLKEQVADEKTNEYKGTLKAFNLPDQMYYDPKTFAERVLELPAHRRVMRRKEKLLEQLKPVFVAIMIVVVGILMVMTTG